jgi:hypothetical protein
LALSPFTFFAGLVSTLAIGFSDPRQQKGDLMDQVSGSCETQKPPVPWGGSFGYPVSAMPDDPPVVKPPVKGGFPLKPPPLPEPEQPPLEIRDPKE